MYVKNIGRRFGIILPIELTLYSVAHTRLVWRTFVQLAEIGTPKHHDLAVGRPRGVLSVVSQKNSLRFGFVRILRDDLSFFVLNIIEHIEHPQKRLVFRGSEYLSNKVGKNNLRGNTMLFPANIWGKQFRGKKTAKMNASRTWLNLGQLKSCTPVWEHLKIVASKAVWLSCRNWYCAVTLPM